MTTAYRKVPCGHKLCHGDGSDKYGLVSCTVIHESHCQGLHDLDPCPGFTYEPWPEVEAVVEAFIEAKRIDDAGQGDRSAHWHRFRDLAALTHLPEANMDEARKLAARYKEMLDYIAANGSGSTLPESWPVWVAENLIADTD